MLSDAHKTYRCANKHSYDVAKEGYVNLLPVQFKHSKEPGDSKAMMLARRAFLEAGFYAPLAHAVAQMLADSSPASHLRVLDLGCGEGYYCRQLAALNPAAQWQLHGVDIAKFAVAAAAKKQPEACFSVASVNRLPYPDHYFDRVLRVFAPSADDELQRVLKPDGQVLMVTPGPRHLWQLKEFIYTEVQAHALEASLPTGFVRLDSTRISATITPEPDQRLALLQMTPFAWQTHAAGLQALTDTAALTIDIDFILTRAAKITDGTNTSQCL